MEQTHNKRSLQLYFVYLMLGGYLVAETTFLKLFCQAYLPDFHYRFLTVPLSIVFGIAAIRQRRLYRGYIPITFSVIFSKFSIDVPAIRPAFIYICQACKHLAIKFYQGEKLRYQLWRKVLVFIFTPQQELLRIRYSQVNVKNSYSQNIATEPTAKVWRNKIYLYCFLAELSKLSLIIIIPWLFWQNVSLWGWFDTSLTFAWEAFLSFVYIYLCNICIMNAIKRQQLAEQSGEDLLELSNIIQSLETEGWQFKYRFILSKPKKNNRWKKYSLKSLISRLPTSSSKLQDIDVLAISPNGCNFVIDLKSHIGEVLWDSKTNTIYRQFGSNPKPLPFKEGNILGKMRGQARELKEQENLSQLPERILVFWRALGSYS